MSKPIQVMLRVNCRIAVLRSFQPASGILESQHQLITSRLAQRIISLLDR